MKTPKVAAVSGDMNAAMMNERVRISAILESAEGKRNPAMAQELALYQALDVESAKRILAKAPAAANPYIEALNRFGRVDLGDGIGAPVETFVNDPKAARLKEIAEVAKRHNEAHGYTKRQSA